MFLKSPLPLTFCFGKAIAAEILCAFDGLSPGYGTTTTFLAKSPPQIWFFVLGSDENILIAEIFGWQF